MEMMLVGIIIFITLVLVFFFYKKSQTGAKLDKTESKPKAIDPVVLQTQSWQHRLLVGLEKSRKDIWSRLTKLNPSDEKEHEQIEELLYSADLPSSIVEDLIKNLSREGSKPDLVKTNLYNSLLSKLTLSKTYQPLEKKQDKGPKVIMIVGVNGVGKTTTIGKLATKLKASGGRVLVGACDTFRAAAVDQLKVWCERAGVDLVRAQPEADPSGVAYDTVNRAYNENYDFCLIDTAGRLHTAVNLMDELQKIKRVIQKINPAAPHEVVLVLDAITGQNATKQAQEFNRHIGLTGLILTKCDGSAKAGSAVAIVSELQLPVFYVGVGESVEDLDVFDAKIYLQALLGLNDSQDQLST